MSPAHVSPPPADKGTNTSSELVGPVVPRSAGRRSWVMPLLIAISLVVHATILLPSLLGAGATTPPPQTEIPIEVVQLPPKPVEKPKAPDKPKTAAKPKPSETKVAEKPKPAEKPKAAEKPKLAEKPKSPEKKIEAKAQPPKAAPKSAPKPDKVAQKPPAPKPAPQKEAAKEPPKPISGADRMRDLLGAMPAVALPGASADGTDEVSYSQLVLSKVAKAKKEGRYPGGINASASVAFTIGDAGDLSTVKIVRPSGFQWLDDEAIAMIKRGAPYPPPPPGGRRDYAITLRFAPLI